MFHQPLELHFFPGWIILVAIVDEGDWMHEFGVANVLTGSVWPAHWTLYHFANDRNAFRSSKHWCR
jgi:hypothetical protein